jgi:hypothetical protein
MLNITKYKLITEKWLEITMLQLEVHGGKRNDSWKMVVSFRLPCEVPLK